MAKVLLVYLILVLVVGLEASCTNDEKLGLTSSNPGESCRNIYDCNPASCGVSGFYWIKTDRVKEVYCDMELNCGGIKGGWMRIANFDTTHGDECPVGWRKVISPQPLCRGYNDAAGC